MKDASPDFAEADLEAVYGLPPLHGLGGPAGGRVGQNRRGLHLAEADGADCCRHKRLLRLPVRNLYWLQSENLQPLCYLQIH